MKIAFLAFSILFFLTICTFCYAKEYHHEERTMWKINTSNKGKFAEFKRLFSLHNCDLEATHHDLDEIDAEPLLVIAHKASQLGENVIVEDTSLDVEGASVGVNVRWLLDHLSDYAGHKAVWTVLLAFRQNEEIHIYKGAVTGTIVLPRGTDGFGFDPVFLPDDSTQTLAESKSDTVNARAKAVEALIKGHIYTKQPVIEKWDGPWQKHD